MAAQWKPGTGLSSLVTCLLEDVMVIGGCGVFGDYDLRVGEVVAVGFDPEHVTVYLLSRRDRPSLLVPIEAVHGIEIGGPGKVTSGGGFVGGGLGIEGAVQGIGLASVLNALSTKTTVKTVIRVDTDYGELFLSSGTLEPQEIRLLLSRPFWAIAQRHREGRSGPLERAPDPAFTSRALEYTTSDWSTEHLETIVDRVLALGIRAEVDNGLLLVPPDFERIVDSVILDVTGEAPTSA